MTRHDALMVKGSDAGRGWIAPMAFAGFVALHGRAIIRLLVAVLGVLPLAPASALTIQVSDLGFQQTSSPVLIGRDNGISARLGTKVLWLYGDTFTSTSGLKSSTAALGSTTDPINLVDVVDSLNVPRQFVPYTRAEQAVNAGGVQRYATWPLAAFSTGRSRGSMFYVSLLVRGEWDWTILGVGTADVVLNQTTTDVRVYRRRRLLFGSGEPLFRPAFSRDEGGISYLYLYSQEPFVARVPVNQMRRRSAYRFWAGDRWEEDLALAQRVANSWLGTVDYNEYLGEYLATYADFFDTRLAVRTAPRPEGPWSEPRYFDVGAPFPSFDFYWHPAFGTGDRIILTYCDETDTFFLRFRTLSLQLHKEDVSSASGAFLSK